MLSPVTFYCMIKQILLKVHIEFSWKWANIGSGNGLVPNRSMFIQFTDEYMRQQASVS